VDCGFARAPSRPACFPVRGAAFAFPCPCAVPVIAVGAHGPWASEFRARHRRLWFLHVAAPPRAFCLSLPVIGDPEVSRGASGQGPKASRFLLDWFCLVEAEPLTGCRRSSPLWPRAAAGAPCPWFLPSLVLSVPPRPRTLTLGSSLAAAMPLISFECARFLLFRVGMPQSRGSQAGSQVSSPPLQGAGSSLSEL